MLTPTDNSRTNSWRRDCAVPLAVAETACERNGWPLRVIEIEADDAPVEQPAAFLTALANALRRAWPSDDGVP